VRFYRQKRPKFQEPNACVAVDALVNDDLGERIITNRGHRAMWISLFAIVCGAAICLSVAAVVMQPVARQTLRG
jgi:hypothetical protein